MGKRSEKRWQAWVVLSIGCASMVSGVVFAAVESEPGATLRSWGGGRSRAEARDDIPIAQRLRIEAELRASLARLGRRGLVPRGASAPVRFAWPLIDVGGRAGDGYHAISNFVDHDLAFPDGLLDWNCGARTYDLVSGYNHSGTDIFLWPFPWNKMDAEEVHAVAAAPGVILEKRDGHFDRNCALSTADWNAVYLLHADGSMSWYGHLKNGTLTAKAVGASVVTGEYLGAVGSSGSSTGPHLHFEVHDAEGALVDPYDGPCNTWDASSAWIEQRPYDDSAINHLSIGPAAVELAPCGEPDISNESESLVRGGAAYFTVFYRDQLAAQVSAHTLFAPGGAVYTSWTHASDEPHYSASFWYFQFEGFALGSPLGTWRYRVVYEGVTYERSFEVVANPDETPSATPSPSPTRTAPRTATPTRPPSPSRTPTATGTARPSATSSATASPSRTAVPSETRTATAAPSSPSPSPTPIAASSDLNCDEVRSVADVSAWIRLRGDDTSSCASGDVDGNGGIDERDLRTTIAAIFAPAVL